MWIESTLRAASDGPYGSTSCTSVSRTSTPAPSAAPRSGSVTSTLLCEVVVPGPGIERGPGAVRGASQRNRGDGDHHHGGGERHDGHDEGEPPEARSEEHTSELQSRFDLVCRLLLEKKKT